MSKGRRRTKRRIVLFVEGDTERGGARQEALPRFFKRWLDPQLPEMAKVGIDAVNFGGVNHYLDKFAKKAELFLEQGEAGFVFGLVDLYGLQDKRVDLSGCESVGEKVAAARQQILALLPEELRDRFRQHFAVHEVEAWLLAYPHQWPSQIRGQIEKRRPEDVDFTNPPSKFLRRLLGRRYRKTADAKRVFSSENPKAAIDKCPHLRWLAEEMLEAAKWLL
jgi:hypothetical protein